MAQAELDRVLARSNALVAQSPLARMPERRRIFLTDGGWRWRWLALGGGGIYGFSRPVSDPVIVINTAHLVAVRDPAKGGRTLPGLIAHETCHGMLRRHFGIGVDLFKPAWLREGYCDVVAQETRLTDAQAAALLASGESHPALLYWEGRRRVAALLAANGGDVDKVFAEAR